MLFFFLLSFLSILFRYYRANSVRYPTPLCEGVCALKHYCAITRVDYREFHDCLESAASALASNSTRPHICIPIVAHIALILAIYTIIKCQQRKLLGEWLHFLFFDLVVNVLLINYMIMAVVNLVHKLQFQQQHNGVRSKLLSSTTSRAMSITSTSLPLMPNNNYKPPILLTFIEKLNALKSLPCTVCTLKRRYFIHVEHLIGTIYHLKNIFKQIHQCDENQLCTAQCKIQTVQCKLCQKKKFHQLVSSNHIQKLFHLRELLSTRHRRNVVQ